MIFILRLAHILAGAFWFGAFIFNARILMPSLRAAGPAANPVLGQLARRIPMAMMSAAIVTIVAGVWLMNIDSAGAPGAWMQSGMGKTFGAGGGLAILAFLAGMIINMPAARRMGAIQDGVAKRGGAPNADEAAQIARLMGRIGTGTVVVAVLLGLATAAMAVARYVP